MNFEKCQWFNDKTEFVGSELADKWKKYEDTNHDDALKYLYIKDPILAKQFVKTLDLPTNVKRDIFKMIDFLQTKKGKQSALKRKNALFDMWLLDYMINFSSPI